MTLQKFLTIVGNQTVRTEPTVVSTGEADAGKIPALGEDGKLDPSMIPAVEEDMPYAKRIDIVSDELIYRGEAAVGSLDNAPAWRIRKLTMNADGDVMETWAGGNANFDKVWANRASLEYV